MITPSENIEVVTHRITATLFLSTTTEGFDQEAEQYIHVWVLPILEYFGRRRQMKRTSADVAVTNLSPRGAQITAWKADYGVTASGIGQSMFAIDFNFEIPMTIDTNQVIF